MIAEVDKVYKTYCERSLPWTRFRSDKYNHHPKLPSKIPGYLSLARVVRFPDYRLTDSTSAAAFCKEKRLHFSGRILTYY